MTWPHNPLEDGDGIGLLNTEVTAAETFLNDIDLASIKQDCFNLYHSGSMISSNTPDPAQISSDRSTLALATHTYDNTTFGADMTWLSHTSASGWTVVGDVRSGYADVPAQITFVGRIGNGNQTANVSRVSGVLLQGNIELRGWTVGGVQELIAHMAFQYNVGGTWRTIAASNRAWSLVEKTTAVEILEANPECSIDMNCTEFFTPQIMEGDGLDPSSDQVEGFRMVISMSVISGFLTGCQLDLGFWNFSAIGLQSGDLQ